MYRVATFLALAALTTACSDRSSDDSEPNTTDASDAKAMETTLIPRAALLGNPEKFRGRISPDGTMISFLAPIDGVQNVMVAPIGDLESAKAITSDANRGIRVYAWAQDGEHVLYMQDQGGNENWQLHAVRVDTAEDRNLTPLEGVQAQIVATSQAHPNEILIGLNDRDAKWHDIHRVEIASGKTTLVETNEGMAGYVADTELNLRMAVKNTADGGSELYRRNDDGEWEKFTTIPAEDALTTNFGHVASDGNTAYGLDSRGRDTAALAAMDIGDGRVRVLAADQEADVAEMLVHPATGEPLAYAVNYEKITWHAVGDEVAKDITVLNTKLGGNFQILGQTSANDMWVLYADNPDAPGHYYVYDRGDQSLRQLFNTRPALDGYVLAPATSHVISARDGLKLVSYLTLPPDADPDENGIPAKALPMVLLVHGGPWARDTYGFSGLVQLLANRGYAVLQVNFRGSTGFGKTFVNAGDKEWGEAMHEDLLDAVEWATAHGVAQSDKIAIMGGSYGGYATLAGLTFTPETFAAGVDIVGPSNLVTLLESIPPYWASFLAIFSQRVGDPRTDEGRELLEARSPLHRANDIVRPLLIGQGANDPRVKQAESDQIVKAMKEKDLPVTYVLYPDEGHGFARPENNLSFFAITENFLSTHLGGRYQAIGAEDLKGSSIEVPEGAELVPGLAESLEASR